MLAAALQAVLAVAALAGALELASVAAVVDDLAGDEEEDIDQIFKVCSRLFGSLYKWIIFSESVSKW